MTLYNTKRHYKPGKVRWNKSTVRKTINLIVADVIAQAQSGEKWRRHPLDEGGQPKADFYFGKAGAIWAVDYLQRIGAVKASLDVSAYLDGLLSENRKYRKRLPHPENSSYLFGELPLLLMQYRIDPREDIAVQIIAAIKENDDQPIRELMWGSAGSMLVALTMVEWTAEKRWAALYRKQARRMMSEWQKIDGVGYLWNIELYSHVGYFLGAVHGFSGNAFALIKGRELLTETQIRQVTTRVMETTVNTALETEDHANWWPRYVSERTDSKKNPLIHLCHGAPGMIVPLSRLPAGVNTKFDEVLLKGGELIWDAGLLEKGPGLCHGTSGNGYAFLKLYERTGDKKWLERAKIYAMYAIEQYDEIRAHYKVPRYPLWTGDPGMAIYLWACLTGDADFPTLDVL